MIDLLFLKDLKRIKSPQSDPNPWLKDGHYDSIPKSEKVFYIFNFSILFYFFSR